jgi:tellurite resistance protein
METLTRPGEHAPTNPPAVAFSSVMGICGLGLSWRAAGQVLAAPPAIGEWLIAVSVMLFIVLSALYGIKTVRNPSIVVAEFRDPSSASNFACITVAVVIVAAAILPHARSAALFLWALGTSGQCVIFLTLLGRWIAEPTEIPHATPAWLVPIVGNVTATLPGVPLGFHETSWFLLAVGLVSWITFLPLLLHRLIFCEDKLPQRLAPSLAIFVASPAVGCLSWLQLTGRVDAVYRFNLFTALFFALLVLRLWQLAVRALPVSVAWWAYTFPSAALASALIRYCEHVPGVGERLLAWAGLALTTIAVAGVGLISLRNCSLRLWLAVRSRPDHSADLPGSGRTSNLLSSE